jgi:aerobic carbon-monoxide dehydrogenase small subunit
VASAARHRFEFKISNNKTKAPSTPAHSKKSLTARWAASRAQMVTSANTIEIVCTVNSEVHSLRVYPLSRLLDVLREQLHLTGTKEGCGEGECGACSVFLNGELVNSCLVPAVQAAGATIKTIESVANGTELDAVQQAFVEFGGAQCGICTPGMVLAAVDLLARNPNPSEQEIRTGLAGNLCRCTGYMKIFESVVRAYQKQG